MTTCNRCNRPVLLPPLCPACAEAEAAERAQAIAEADARAKAVHEFYSTPRWVVDEALDTLEHIANQHDAEIGAVLAAAKAGALVFDPAMGGVVRDGRIVERPVYLDTLRERFPHVGGADCRHTSAATHIDGTHLCPFEMLSRDLLDGCVLAATNPPFSLYRRFVERGLEVAGAVVLLLPVGVMEVRRRTTAEDVAWWRKYGPRWLVTHRRIRFGGATSSAFQFYAHFVWMRADVGSGMLPRVVSADGTAMRCHDSRGTRDLVSGVDRTGSWRRSRNRGTRSSRRCEMREIDVRRALHQELADHFAYDSTTMVVDELPVGTARVDVAAINGSLHGFEIKSDRDSLDRLPHQIEEYSRVFDHVTLVAGTRHIEHALGILPDWWGLVEASSKGGDVVLGWHRKSVGNPERDPVAIASLLWLDEARLLLEMNDCARGTRSKPRYKLPGIIAQRLSIDVIDAFVRASLKGRKDWRAERPGTMLP